MQEILLIAVIILGKPFFEMIHEGLRLRRQLYQNGKSLFLLQNILENKNYRQFKIFFHHIDLDWDDFETFCEYEDPKKMATAMMSVVAGYDQTLEAALFDSQKVLTVAKEKYQLAQSVLQLDKKTLRCFSKFLSIVFATLCDLDHNELEKRLMKAHKKEGSALGPSRKTG